MRNKREIYFHTFLALMILVYGCASMDLKGAQRASASISMNTWDTLADEVLKAYNDPATSDADKLLIKTQIKPKMLKLHDIITQYTDMIINFQEKGTSFQGAAELRSQAIALLQEINILFSKVKK